MRGMFKSVLVANRGEIAVRICKTLRRMGIRSVVVASIPDRRSLAVRSADAWVLLEGYSAAESYLDIDAVIAAAKAEGCEAIHPGYGFLSERADFAERCAAEGITFIGPPPAVLRSMGDKAAARQLAVANGVPVVPGWDGTDDPDTLVREAARIGYPVMLKARGGGGGRGMREVFAPEHLPEAIESARREALAAFGDGGLLLEKLVTNAHHVEVQVLADTHSNVIHLGERDCSVQRRHQKLIEETPSPVVDDALRERLTGYALKLARAINYVNAGTFEFLVVPSSPAPSSEGSRERGPGAEGPANVYFLEVNPRLQVEHPVTEMVTGLDLVEFQLRIAAGEPLPMKQGDVTFSGHAIEFRINAEDPWDGFKPSSGRVEATYDKWEHRFDSGVAPEDEVFSYYDSLLAKAVVHCASRAEVFAELDENGYDEIRLHHGRTNGALLQAIGKSSEFREGNVDIGWLEAHLEELLQGTRAGEEEFVAAAVFGLTSQAAPRLRLRPDRLPSPFLGSRWIGAGSSVIWLDDGASKATVTVRMLSATSGIAELGGRQFPLRVIGELVHVGVPEKVFRPLYMHNSGSISLQWIDAPRRSPWFHSIPPPPLPRRAHAAAEGATAIVAPLPGSIATIRVAEGDAFESGQLLLVLEAMKMEHRITAPVAGVVKTVNVRERGQVRDGDVLVELA
jgi:acetyl/propionyl-CoA carboxylase alpha subunit